MSDAAAKPTSALRQAGPLLLTTLVNRIGTIGLSLLPILIVQRGFTTAEASLTGRFAPVPTFWFPLALALGLIFYFRRRFDEAVRD